MKFETKVMLGIVPIQILNIGNVGGHTHSSVFLGTVAGMPEAIKIN